MSRGDAAAGDVDIPWRRVAATPRLVTWIFREGARLRYLRFGFVSKKADPCEEACGAIFVATMFGRPSAARAAIDTGRGDAAAATRILRAVRGSGHRRGSRAARPRRESSARVDGA